MTFSKKKLKELYSIGYGSWLEMKDRCLNSKSPGYKNYGGRGISISKEWDTFAGFISSMGHRPPGTSIERKDVNGNYEPGNCVWISNAYQQKNTRRTIFFEIDGEKMCMKDACEKLGVSYTMVRLRIWKLGWDKDLALMTPKKENLGRPTKTPLSLKK